MNPTFQRMLGGGQMALGAATGNSQALVGGINRFKGVGAPMAPTANTMDVNTGIRTQAPPPPMPGTAPMPMSSPDVGGGDLPRPTLMRPGNRVQQLDMGPKPTQPGFKFPSVMWTGTGG